MSLYFDFLLAAEEINPFFTDVYLAKILAMLYVHGGACESTVYDDKFNSLIRLAQKRFNINGGEIPTRKGILLINKFVKELENPKSMPIWAIDIAKKFNIKGVKNE